MFASITNCNRPTNTRPTAETSIVEFKKADTFAQIPTVNAFNEDSSVDRRTAISIRYHPPRSASTPCFLLAAVDFTA